MGIERFKTKNARPIECFPSAEIDLDPVFQLDRKRFLEQVNRAVLYVLRNWLTIRAKGGNLNMVYLSCRPFPFVSARKAG